MGQLKLAGMRAAYDEVITAGLRAQHSVQRIIGELLLAQLADNRARSTAYRLGVARFPVMKNQGMEAPAECDMEAIGEEGDEDMRLDARCILVKDRPNGEVAFEVPERLLDADKLEVQAPQPRRIVVGEIGAQEIPALAPPGVAQLRAIEAIAECGAVRSDLDCD